MVGDWKGAGKTAKDWDVLVADTIAAVAAGELAIEMECEPAGTHYAGPGGQQPHEAGGEQENGEGDRVAEDVEGRVRARG